MSLRENSSRKITRQDLSRLRIDGTMHVLYDYDEGEKKRVGRKELAALSTSACGVMPRFFL